jgi:hypothetical protein
MKKHLIVGAALVILTAACGAGYSSSEKLGYAVTQFNEGVRWGRLGEVLPRVDMKAREHFMALHAGWGSEIQISAYEIVQTVIDDKVGKAEVTIVVSWYRVKDMEAKDTVLVQRWMEEDSEWLLIAEEYQSGSPF